MNLNRILKYNILVLFLLIGIGQQLFSQNQYKSTKALKKDAEKLFDDENYVDAMPLFSQLLSLEPRDYLYNYKYGVCLLYSDGDRKKPLKHLRYASENEEVPREVFFYLGKTYHLNFKFKKAIDSYNKFLNSAGRKELAKHDAERQIEMCKNGQRLLRDISDLIVLEKKDVRELDFFRSFDLSAIGGRILVTPEDLLSRYDQRSDERFLFHMPAKQTDMVFFSSYGDDRGENGRDLYRVRRLPTGEWGEPQILPSTINTKFDDDFGFMHPNGREFFFASKGHNSMGGYDIFRSEYDPDTDTFFPPENMDFAINTPADDFFYIVDSLDNVAYFASNRSSAHGRLHIYQVKVDRDPAMMAVLRGTFFNKIVEASKDARIIVQDPEGNQIYGEFNTDSKDGGYFITLPRGGKYKFLVEADESEYTHTGMVEIPKLKELRPLKQELLLVDRNGTEQLVIKNKFDEEFDTDDDVWLAMEELINEKAELDPNATAAMLDDLERRKREKEEAEKKEDEEPIVDFNNEELIELAKKDADEAERELNQLRNDLDLAYNVAKVKNEEAKKLKEKAQREREQATSITDEIERDRALSKARRTERQANKSAEEANSALQLAKQLEINYDRKKKETDLAANYALALEEADKADNFEEAFKQIEDIREELEKAKEEATARQDQHLVAEKKAREKDREVEALKNKAEELRKEERTLSNRIKSLEKQKDQERKKSVKEDIQVEIDIYQEQKEEIGEEVTALFNQMEEEEKEAAKLRREAEFMNKMMSGELADLLKENEDLYTDPETMDTQSLEEDIASYEFIPEEDDDDFVADDTTEDRTTSEQDDDLISDSSTEDFQSERTSVKEARQNISDDFSDEDFASLPPADQEKQKQLTEEYVNLVDEEIALLEKQAQSTGNEEEKMVFEQEINELKQEKMLRENQLMEYDQLVDADDTTTETQDSVEDTETDEIMESTKGLLSQVDDDIEELDRQIAASNDPEEKQRLEQKKEDFIGLKNKLETRLGEQDVVDTETDRDTDVDTAETEKTTVPDDDIVENYADYLEEIEDSQEDFTENIEQRKQLIDQINEDLAELDKQIEETGDRDEKQVLEQQRKQLQSFGQEQEKTVKDLEIVEKRQQDEQVTEEFQAKLDAVDTSDPTTAQDELEAIDRDLEQEVNKINMKMRQTTDPDELMRLDDHKDDLISLQVENQKKRESLEEELAMKSDTDRDNEEEEASLTKEEVEADYEEFMVYDESEIEDTGSTTDLIAKQENIKTLSEKLEMDITNLESKQDETNLTKREEQRLTILKDKLEEEAKKLKLTEERIEEQTKVILAEEYGYDEEFDTSVFTEDPMFTNKINEDIQTLEARIEATDDEQEKTILEKQKQVLESYKAEGEELLADEAESREKSTEEDAPETYSMSLHIVAKKTGHQASIFEDANKSEALNEQVDELETLYEELAKLEEERAEASGRKARKLNDEIEEKQQEIETKNRDLNTFIASSNREESENLSEDINTNIASLTALNEETDSYQRQLDEIEDLLEEASEKRKQAENESGKRKQQLLAEATEQEFNAIDRLAKLNDEIEEKQAETELAMQEEDDEEFTPKTTSSDEKDEDTADESPRDEETERDTDDSQPTDDTTDRTADGTDQSDETPSDIADETTTESDEVDEDVFDSDTEDTDRTAETDTQEKDPTTAPEPRDSDESKTTADTSEEEDEEFVYRRTPSTETTQDITPDDVQTMFELDDEEAEKIKENEEYQYFFKIKAKAKRKMAEAQVEYDKADELRADADDKIRQSKQKMNEYAEETDPERKQQLLAEAKQLNDESSKIYRKIKTIERVAENLEAEAKSQEFEADLFLNSLDRQSYDELTALVPEDEPEDRSKEDVAIKSDTQDDVADTTPVEKSQPTTEDTDREERDQPDASDEVADRTTEETTTTPTPPTDRDEPDTQTTPPTAVELDELVIYGGDYTQVATNTSVFKRTDSPAYSTDRPIPISPKLPEGLVFKVQVGAFRNPVPNDLFSEFAPLSAEPAGNGITRYTAGFFRNFNQADQAKNEIRNIGYSDAFVVAFYNGERISVARARQLMEDGVLADQGSTSFETTETTTTTQPDRQTETETTTTTPTTPNDRDESTSYYSDPNAAEASQVETIEGLFYTVQIGVYSKPVTASQLYNISPLNTERTSSGYIRYTTGMYSSVEEASRRKDQIVNTGISDAFVTAYYNGERITVSAGRQMEQEIGPSVLITRVKTPGDQTEETTPETVETDTQPTEATTYTLFLGNFEDDIPSGVANVVLRYFSQGIERNKQNDGTVTYLLGNFSSRQEAETLKRTIESEEEEISIEIQERE